MDWKPFILSNPAVLAGKPAFAGTRISVAFLLELLAAGWSHEMIFENYPNIHQDHLRALYAYLQETTQLDSPLQSVA